MQVNSCGARQRGRDQPNTSNTKDTNSDLFIQDLRNVLERSLEL
jgi:hypothetical protein